jgi:hypothetical protein
MYYQCIISMSRVEPARVVEHLTPRFTCPFLFNFSSRRDPLVRCVAADPP